MTYSHALQPESFEDFPGADDVHDVLRLDQGGYLDAVEEPYDAVEIYGVSISEGQGLHHSVEPIIGFDAKPDYYTVYVHLEKGGIQAVGDFLKPKDTLRYARKISNAESVPVFDYRYESVTEEAPNTHSNPDDHQKTPNKRPNRRPKP